MPEGRQQGGPVPLPFEQFAGVNTATTRFGVPDEQAAWLDGFMPLAARNLRTLPDIGTTLYTASGSLTVVCFSFYNIGAATYGVMFLSDGSAVQVNTATGATTAILPTGTILAPSITGIGTSQYGQQYLLIVANQANGYWVWDGTLLYAAGTLAPGVVLTNVGAGYSTPPLVTATGGSGHGAAFAANIDLTTGQVVDILITNPGTGYSAGDTPTLTISGGTSAGSGGTLSATLSATGGTGAALSLTWGSVGSIYSLLSITVTAMGSGYDGLTTAQFSTPPGTSTWESASGAPGIRLTVVSGTVTAASIVPTADNPSNLYANNSGLVSASVTDVGSYYVSSVGIISRGSGYSPSTTVSVTGGGSPYVAAIVKPILANGSIASVTIVSGGAYGSNVAPTLTVNDISTTASATISVMPFGVQGTAVETYQGHVWVFDGNVFNFTAPGSVSDFSTSDGGGSDQSNASYLKVGYVAAVSTNGFLFLIGDSSMDYISGVQTNTPSGGSPTTTFSQNNADPEIGTPYPASVATLGQDILIANSTGIFVSSGGAFVKISEAMDGVYNTVPSSDFFDNPFSGFQLSTAKATIFGKRVWMVLVPIVDPVSGATGNKLLMMRDRKFWWASSQSRSLTFVNTQEINSIYTAWGTDGTRVFPLFRTPGSGFLKTAQTRLWDAPDGYEFNKAASRYWSLWQCYSTVATTHTLTVDAVGISDGGQFTTSSTYTIAGPGTVGYFVTPPQAVGQQGVVTGYTIKTSAADMALATAKVAVEDTGYRG